MLWLNLGYKPVIAPILHLKEVLDATPWVVLVQVYDLGSKYMVQMPPLKEVLDAKPREVLVQVCDLGNSYGARAPTVILKKETLSIWGAHEGEECGNPINQWDGYIITITHPTAPFFFYKK